MFRSPWLAIADSGSERGRRIEMISESGECCKLWQHNHDPRGPEVAQNLVCVARGRAKKGNSGRSDGFYYFDLQASAT